MVFASRIEKKAIIMAAGYGRRMRPLTENLPKPLLTVCNKPFIGQTIEQAIHTTRLSDFVITTHYLGGLIQHYLGYGGKFSGGININYLVENPLVNAAQGAMSAFHSFDFPTAQPFWIFGGDVFAPEMDFSKIQLSHEEAFKRSHVLGTIAFNLVPLKEFVGRYGVWIIDESNFLVRTGGICTSESEARSVFEEIKSPRIKAESEKAGTPLFPINTLFMVLEGNFFERTEACPGFNNKWDFPEMFNSLGPGTINSCYIDSPWMDINSPEALWRAQWYFLKNGFYPPDSNYIQGRGREKGGTSLDPHHILNSVVGKNATIQESSVVNSVIGNGCYIHNTTIDGCVVLPNTYLNLRSGRNMKIRNCIIGGSIIGGTFIDPVFDKRLSSLEKKIVFVKDTGEIVTTNLKITDEDISTAFGV